jgi:disulfide bond formation protein DsbB
MLKTMNKPLPSYLFFLILLMCAGSIAFALIMQINFNVQPCPLCVLQRLTIIIISLFSLVGIFIRHGILRKILWVILVALTIVGFGIACKQIWVEAHPQVTSYICQVQIGGQFDGWPFSHFFELLFGAKTTCERALYKLLGITFATWSSVFFIILFIISIIGLRLKSKGLRK